MPQVQPVQSVNSASGMPMIQQVQVAPEKKKDNSNLIKIIVIVIEALVAVAFIGLFIWIFLQYDDVKTNMDSKIADAVAKAKDEQFTKDEEIRLENEKYPYKTFSGPVDYGQLRFEYPKTWSVYIAKDAANGGDFEAYLNPLQVNPVSNTAVNALRVEILDKSFDDVAKNYQGYLNNKDKPLNVESVTVNDTVGNKYVGVIPSTDLNGIILILKIRDKTAVLRTDSMLFEDDFNKLIETITFNS